MIVRDRGKIEWIERERDSNIVSYLQRGRESRSM